MQHFGGSTLLQSERVPLNSLPHDLTTIAKVNFPHRDVADPAVQSQLIPVQREYRVPDEVMPSLMNVWAVPFGYGAFTVGLTL